MNEAYKIPARAKSDESSVLSHAKDARNQCVAQQTQDRCIAAYVDADFDFSVECHHVCVPGTREPL
jgi:hypothetical protein